MADRKRNHRTWFLILAVGFFFLHERLAAVDLTITSPSTFSSLDGSAADADGVANGVLTVSGNLTIASGGSITCNDPSSPVSDSACPIRIAVSGNLEIRAGGSILAENNFGAGSGGNIDINAGGNVTLRAAGVDPGALISASKNGVSAGTGVAGNITITLGNSGFTMEPGSRILANSTARAGAIVIDGARAANVEGLVQSRSTATGTGAVQAPGGGPITINAGCSLSVGDAGVVSSQGNDPGADLVHLQACNVAIDGLVQSAGPGFAIPNSPANHCGSPTRPDKPSNSTACVEIWGGDSVTIDATPTHSGQVSADIGSSGGATGHGWIDVFARGSISLTGNSAAPFAVHADMVLPNGHAGAITVLSQSGAVSTGGLAVQASDTAPGSRGGSVLIRSGGAGSPAGDVSLGTAAIEARGAASGGGGQAGGEISARSFNAAIRGASPGSLNASGGGTASPGAMTLEACTGIFYTGVVTPPATLFTPICGGGPVFQAYVSLPPAGCVAACAAPTPTPTNAPTSTPTASACGAAVSGTTTICNGSATTIQAALTGTGPWTLTWSDGFIQTVAASPANRSVAPPATTTYTITSVSTAGCTGSGSGHAKVKVKPTPSSAITAPPSVCASSSGNQASVPNAGALATYAWSISNGTITSGAGSKSIKFSAGGPAGSTVRITVTVRGLNGCRSRSKIKIPINC
jgi:hypothetical protein